MEMKHTCKLCSRHFSNGRALGGHMRSHVISAGGSGVASTASDSASSGDEQKPQPATPASYVLRENPKRSIKFTDPEYFSSSFLAPVDHGESSIVQDQESDIESSPRAGAGGGATARRVRSKRRRRSSPPSPPIDFEPASSVSDATPEEDVAVSLIMLSRDSWNPKPDPEPTSTPEPDNGSNKARTRFECNMCKKVFRSFQALGGHRAGYKNGKVRCVGLSGEKPSTVINGFESDSLINDNVHGPKASLHPCPFCPKMFSSGQALGGHKKSHMKSSHDNGNVISSDAIVNSVPASSSSSPVGFIDLNLPAPVEDEFEMSAVYDAEFDQIKMA
ncbi:zinc finger protein ZAT9-like [Carex rostrata]